MRFTDEEKTLVLNLLRRVESCPLSPDHDHLVAVVRGLAAKLQPRPKPTGGGRPKKRGK